ncbi:efflux RND transporter periplasmic adaptor subunit [Consotaella aegiceratis]|uniref:efflux RND transporter periplasmic adaptor subunit n=1 Tax=Consotaella aegiceratis TaxID=3097961 RepID=UPI002F3F607F
MAFVKQLAVTFVVLLIAGAIWLRLDARPGQYILDHNPGLPSALRDLIASISPDDEPEQASRPSDAGSEKTASRAPRGSGGGGRFGGGGPVLVVVDQVTQATTRNRLRAIGSGEAQRSVSVYPDVSGFVREVLFSSGDEVEAGDILASLENDTEALALDRARIAVDAAEGKLTRYRRLEASRATTTVEVADVERELENAKLDLRAAEIALEKRSVRAPIAGRVGIADIDTGDLVSSQTLIATIDDRSKLKVVFYVPEGFVPGLAIGQEVQAVSVANPASVYHGEVSAIDSRLDQASRTMRVQATIDNPNDELRPGMSFALTLLFPGADYLSVDPLAIQWERAGPFIWKIAGDEPVKSPVRIIERNVDRVLISADEIALGDLVVIEGQQSIRPGAKVTVQHTAPGEAPTDASPPAEAGSSPAEASSADDGRRAAIISSAHAAVPASFGDTPAAGRRPSSGHPAAAAR